MSVLCVIGGQYGSEGKGVVVHHLANRYQIHVRVGGPNAGHTFWHLGHEWKMRSVPCGWVNPDATLVIGAGAVVDLTVLIGELSALEAVGYSVRNRLLLDYRAVLIGSSFRQYERDLRDSIGSTGEGVGAARVARILRDPGKCYLAGDRKNWILDQLGVDVRDTADFLTLAHAEGTDILLEGTQGAGLSLLFGPWPYVTSQDVSAAQLLADCGLPPKDVRVLMVLRTYPIRVGGNSGPLPGEFTWDQLSERLGYVVRERTTVTGRLRRIGQFDSMQVVRAVERNQPDEIALMFVDYLCARDRAVTEYEKLSGTSRNFINHLEDLCGAPVTLIGTGRRDIIGPFTVIDRVPGRSDVRAGHMA